MDETKIILTKDVAFAKLHRMALEVAEHLSGNEESLIIIGIKKNGLLIANKVAMLMKPYVNFTIEIIPLQLNKENAAAVTFNSEINFNDKNVLVVDDVCNSGRTLLYALKPLLQFKPYRIQTLVLVERMHKLFPIKPDYVGLSVATTLSDFIQVEVKDDDITAMLNSYGM